MAEVLGDRAVPRAVAAMIKAILLLETPGTLEEIRGARPVSEAEPASPQWFAAAASSEASLMEMAPELLANRTDADGGSIDADVDIIAIYAPESRVEAAAPAAEPESAQPRSVRMDLLREIQSLDS